MLPEKLSSHFKCIHSDKNTKLAGAHFQTEGWGCYFWPWLLFRGWGWQWLGGCAAWDEARTRVPMVRG